MKTSSLAALLLSTVLAGCSAVPQENPYAYRFSDPVGKTLCLHAETVSDDAVVLSLRKELKEKGFEVVETHSGCGEELTLQVIPLAGGELRFVLTLMRTESRPSVSAEQIIPRADSTEVSAVNMAVDRLVDRLFPDPMPWNVP